MQDIIKFMNSTDLHDINSYYISFSESFKILNELCEANHYLKHLLDNKDLKNNITKNFLEIALNNDNIPKAEQDKYILHNRGIYLNMFSKTLNGVYILNCI